MSEVYYVRVRGRTLGPYELDTIRQMARKAQIGRSHEVSLDGMSWTSASTYREIFERPIPPTNDSVTTTGNNGNAAVLMETTSQLLPEAHPPSSGVRSTMWHYTMNGQQQTAPIDQLSLINLIATGQVAPDDNVWNETMSDWASVAYVPQLAAYALPNPSRHFSDARLPNPTQGFPIIPTNPRPSSGGQASPDYQRFIGRKTAAGVLALFLGNLGIHKFMLGLTTGGITMLLLFFLLIPIPVLTVISFVEGILYLSKSDEQFFRDYAVDKKQWF